MRVGRVNAGARVTGLVCLALLVAACGQDEDVEATVTPGSYASEEVVKDPEPTEDPMVSLRYVDVTQLDREYNWSDRDQRHRLNAFLIAKLPYDILLNNRLSYYSAQPTSESCGPTPSTPFAAPAGERANTVFGSGSDRNCENGSIIKRNTLRKDNEFFSLDVRLSKIFEVGTGEVEAIVEVFNLLNTDNFRDPTFAGFLFNFDGTVQSGLGDPRQVQVGVKYRF